MKIKSEENLLRATNGPATFLQEGISLSDEEKLRNFDELKKLCEEMKEKALCYQRRCDYIQGQIKQSEQEKTHKKKKKCNKAKVYTPNFDSSLFEVIEEDDTIPPGWRSAWRTLDGFSKGGKVKVYWEPNGKYCPSRVNAINQMITILDSSEEDIDIMKKTLFEEGWKSSQNLPDGWMFNKSSSKETKVFVDSKFRYFRNIKSAVKELILEYSDEMLVQFLVTFVLNSVKDREESRVEDVELKKDPQIPECWKVGHIKNRNFKSSLFVLTAEGQTLMTFSKIKEVINNSTDLTDEEKESFISYLSKLRNRGFKDPVTTKEEKAESKPDVSRPAPVVKAAPAPAPAVVKTVVKSKSSPLSWETDPSIPDTWKIAVVHDEQFGTKKYFMDHSGSTFHGRLEALRAMVRSPQLYPQSEFRTMKRGLSVDGWEESDACPTDWLRKKKNVKNEKRESFIYLSNNFVVLDTFEKVITYLNNGGFSEDVINNFKSKNGLNWQTDPLLPPGWTFANHQTEKQGIIKRLLDPYGKICFSSAHAIRTVFETSGDCAELRSLKTYMLESDGWFQTRYLPTGWMIKQKRSETGFYILNEKYEKFNTMIALKSYLLKSKHGKEAVERFEKNYKGLQQPVVYCKSKQSKKQKFKVGSVPAPVEAVKTPDIKNTVVVEEEEEEEEKEEEVDDDDDDMVLSDDELEEMNLDTSFSSAHGDDPNIESKENSDEMDPVEDESDSEEVTELVWETDAALPLGWKINIFELTYGEMRGVKLKRYRSPCDNYFGNLPAVLKFLETNTSYSDTVKSIFSRGLGADGWERIGSVSEGWMSKYVKGRGRQYLSPDYEVFSSLEEVATFLKEQDYREEEINNFLEKIRGGGGGGGGGRAKRASGDKLTGSGQKKLKNMKGEQEESRTSNQPPELPANWRCEIEDDEEVIYNEEGAKFESRREAAEFLIKNNFPPKVIYALWSSLDREGWQADNKAIPPGWRQKFHPQIHDYKYVTRELTLLNSSEEALRFIQKDEELSRNCLDLFQSWVDEVRKKSPKIMWKCDPALPTDWFVSCGLNIKPEILKHSSGGRFETKQAAIDFMIKERHSSQDIFKIWNTLHTEGWVSDDQHLPRGWKRKFINEKKNYFYLSPMMEVVKSSKQLLNIVMTSSDYDLSDVKKVENWRKKTIV